VNPAAVLAALATGCLVWSALSTSAATRRLRSLEATIRHDDDGAAAGAPSRRSSIDVTTPFTRAVVSAGATGVVVVLVGCWVGLVVGLVTAVSMFRFLRGLDSALDRRRAAAIVAALPMGATLLATCLRVGRPVEPSVAAVGAALGGPLGDEFVHVAASLALGAAPSQAWHRLLSQPATARFARTLARTLVRTWESGAPLAETLESLAVACRATARAAAQQRAKAVGVQTAAPLGLCFLPAFVAVGLVPVIVGVVSGVISGLF